METHKSLQRSTAASTSGPPSTTAGGLLKRKKRAGGEEVREPSLGGGEANKTSAGPHSESRARAISKQKRSGDATTHSPYSTHTNIVYRMQRGDDARK